MKAVQSPQSVSTNKNQSVSSAENIEQKGHIDPARLQKMAPEMTQEVLNNLGLQNDKVKLVVEQIGNNLDINLSFMASIPPGASISKIAQNIAANIGVSQVTPQLNKTMYLDPSSVKELEDMTTLSPTMLTDLQKISTQLPMINYLLNRSETSMQMAASGIDKKTLVEHLGLEQHGSNELAEAQMNLVKLLKMPKQDASKIRQQLKTVQAALLNYLSANDSKLTKKIKNLVTKDVSNITDSHLAAAGESLNRNKNKELSSHDVQKGDTLWAIAEKEYGDGNLWPLIAKANGMKTTGNPILKEGMLLKVPAKPMNTSGLGVSSGDLSLSGLYDLSGPSGAHGGVNSAQLKAIVPKLSPQRAEALVPHLNSAMHEAGINTKRQKAAFIAQLAHESGSFKHWVELGNDSYFKKYNNRKSLGNGPNDGARFKGRGPIQLTGRANYRSAGKALGLDLENNPDLVSKPAVGFRVAAWFWNQKKLNGPAEAGDFRKVTKRINGGTNGLRDRTNYYNRALAVMDSSATATNSSANNNSARLNLNAGTSSIRQELFQRMQAQYQGSQQIDSQTLENASQQLRELLALNQKISDDLSVKNEPMLKNDNSPKNYIVRTGDSLSIIAARHQVTIEELKQLNPNLERGEDFNLLEPGDQIRLPKGLSAIDKNTYLTTDFEFLLAKIAIEEGRVPPRIYKGLKGDARYQAALGSQEQWNPAPISGDTNGVKPLRQGAGRGRLGFGRSTLARAGCMLTSFAMASTKLTGKDWSVNSANEAVKRGGGFSGSNLKSSVAAGNLGMRMTARGSFRSLKSKMIQNLKAGKPVVVGVDYKRGSSSAASNADHFVTITGINKDGSFNAIDPASGKQISFSPNGKGGKYQIVEAALLERK